MSMYIIFMSQTYPKSMQPFYKQYYPLSNQLIQPCKASGILYILHFNRKIVESRLPITNRLKQKEKANKNLPDQNFLLNLCVQPCVGNSQHNHILGRPSFVLFYVGEVPHSKNSRRKTIEQNKVTKSCSTK